MANLLSNTTVGGNTSFYTNDEIGKVIDRGNPGSGSPLLLSDYGVVHYYYANGVSDIQLSTTMVEDAVYELYYMTTTSGNNIDIIIYPNYTTYGGQFTMKYWGSPNFFDFAQTQSFFYFDHLAGGTGNTPCGRFLIYNMRNLKQVQYRGGDTTSVNIGTGRWNNNSTQWVNVGTLVGLQGGNVRVTLRRIA
jgi:hypothetical protein